MNVAVAKLDADGVFMGTEEKALDDVRSGDIVFNAETFEHSEIDGVTWLTGGIDLPPGRYRWFGSQFVPLSAAQAMQSGTPPLVEKAFYALVLQLVTSGGRSAVPDYTLQWGLWYENTFDGSPGTRPLRALIGT